MAETKLTFDQNGGIKVEATGYVGTACAETTELLLKNLGSTKKAEQRKPEYNQRAKAGSRATVGR